MTTLEELLQSWRCEEALVALKEHLITVETLQLLSAEDIRDLLPVVGLRARFREKLFEWKQKKLRNNSKNSEKTVFVDFENAVGSFYLKLPSVLTETVKGKAILDFYKSNGNLLGTHRSQLIDIIIEKVFEKNIKLSVADFDYITKQIVNSFPKENKYFYFLKRGPRKNPSGKLYDRYYNLLNRRRAIKKTSSKISDLLDDDEELNLIELTKLKELMKTDVTATYKNNKVTDAWMKTFPLRQKDLKKSDNNTQFLSNWPAFKEAFGYKLIQTDFKAIYTGKLLLFDLWEDFKKKIFPYLDGNIKDKKSREYFAELKHIKNEGIKFSDIQPRKEFELEV